MNTNAYMLSPYCKRVFFPHTLCSHNVFCIGTVDLQVYNCCENCAVYVVVFLCMGAQRCGIVIIWEFLTSYSHVTIDV